MTTNPESLPAPRGAWQVLFVVFHDMGLLGLTGPEAQGFLGFGSGGDRSCSSTCTGFGPGFG